MDVLLSIQPKWCDLIARGYKTVEIRKSRPKIDVPFKCYIYCTLSGSKEFFVEQLQADVAEWNRGDWGNRKGNVIGEFICDHIVKMPYSEFALGYSGFHHWWEERLPHWAYNLHGNACLADNEIEAYLGKRTGYAWHISELKIYEKPRELSEFCLANKRLAFDFGETYMTKTIGQPPQSWCYVEERASK